MNDIVEYCLKRMCVDRQEELKKKEKELADLKVDHEAMEELYRYRCERHKELQQLVGELIDEWDKDYGDMASVIDKLKQVIKEVSDG